MKGGGYSQESASRAGKPRLRSEVVHRRGSDMHLFAYLQEGRLTSQPVNASWR